MTQFKEWVNAQQVMHFIDRAEPDMSDLKKAEKAGKSARRLYAYRKQQKMTRDVAEDLLDAFDLGYLLHTGDIGIERVEVHESMHSKMRRAQAANKNLRAEVTYWKNRALAAESAQPVHPSLSPLNPIYWENVNSL